MVQFDKLSISQVVVRVRPLRKKERLQGQHTVVHTGSDNSKLLLQKKQDPRNPYLSSGKAVNYHYTVRICQAIAKPAICAYRLQQTHVRFPTIT